MKIRWRWFHNQTGRHIGAARAFGFTVTPKRRKPNANVRVKFFRLLFQRRKAVRKPVVELPQRPVIVPAVIKQKRIHLNAPFLYKLLPDSINRAQTFRFVEFPVGP